MKSLNAVTPAVCGYGVVPFGRIQANRIRIVSIARKAGLMTNCLICHEREGQHTALIQGKYYPNVCAHCLAKHTGNHATQAASHDRRRGYEDHAQDTVQPYDANGQPSKEFYRLYPDTAQKMYSPTQIDDIKRQI
jgi:hypothetical protein